MKGKKNVRQRGSKTHGWGAKKKHRGAGNRGGRGNAGSGKRADHRKPIYWDNRKPMRAGQKRGQNYFGKYGFFSATKVTVNAINVRDLECALSVWQTEKKVQKTGDAYTVDLAALGIHRLLGAGSITSKVHVKVAHASPRAIEKVAAVGGTVN